MLKTWRRWPVLLYLLLMLTACRGVLDVQIYREGEGTAGSLGKVAYIFGGDVWLLDMDDETHVRLTRDGHNRRPTVSADGSWLAYLCRDGLYVQDLRAGQEIELAAYGVSDYAWSPRGSYLGYRGHTGLAIWDGERQANVALPAEIDGVSRLAWDASGECLAVESATPLGAEIVLISLEEAGARRLYQATDPMSVPRLGPWSPDGRWLLLWVGSRHVEAERDGLPLCLAAPEDGALQCLSDEALPLSGLAAWSVDGRLAAIVGEGRETWVNKGLAVIEAEEPALRWLVTAADQAPVYPAWSPDGRRVAYSAGPVVALAEAHEQRDAALAGRRIWVVDATTGERRQITRDGPYRDERPLWSRDGDWILFARIGAEGAGLFLMRADGSELWQVVPELTPQPDPPGEYGYIDWDEWWSWWRPEIPGQRRIASKRQFVRAGAAFGTYLSLAPAMAVARLGMMASASVVIAVDSDWERA